jgi:hypothetical protein
MYYEGYNEWVYSKGAVSLALAASFFIEKRRKKDGLR